MNLENSNKDAPIIYYESKLQYYVVTLVALVVFLILTLTDIGGLADISIYFLGISLCGLGLVSVYKVSVFELTDQEFIWKKGKLKIISPWSEVLAIHYDWAPALANVHRKFRSTGFFIETKNGMTNYADKTNIKRQGQRTFSSLGDELISEIMKKSSAPEKIGEVSMFKQTQKSRGVVFLLLGIFVIPAIIISFYYLLYGSI